MKQEDHDTTLETSVIRTRVATQMGALILSGIEQAVLIEYLQKKLALQQEGRTNEPHNNDI